MQNKVVAIFVCMLLLVTAVPVIKALNSKTITTTPVKSSGDWIGFFFGSVANWYVLPDSMGTTFNAVNIYVISFLPLEIVHFTNNEDLAFSGFSVIYNGFAIGFGSITQ